MSAPIRAPEIAELETLAACAAEGTFVGAAARLGVSRPAVAKRVDNLEALIGRPLLNRGGRGVRLTDAGAALLAGARRMLDERDRLLSLMGDIRGDGPSPIAGLRELLGDAADTSRAAQQPEVRLAETERVLALILRDSATGVVISDPEAAVVHEVNDAFCRFTGRSREEVLRAPAIEKHSWYGSGDRDRVIDEVRRTGLVEGVLVHALHPDGTVRVGQATARFIPLAGARRLLATIDDVTDKHRLEVERTAGIGSYRAVAQVSKLLFAGNPPVESIASVIPEVQRTGALTTVALWDLERESPHAVAGEPPPGDLHQKLHRAELLAGGSVLRIDATHPTPDGPTGWAAPLGSVGHALVLLNREPLPATTQALYVEVLGDIATMVASTTG